MQVFLDLKKYLHIFCKKCPVFSCISFGKEETPSKEMKIFAHIKKLRKN